VEARGAGGTKRVRPFDVEGRKQIDGELALRARDYIRARAAAKEPFLLAVGWTRAHQPSDVPPEFAGKSGIGKYGDGILELDHRTGEVLDAIREAGIEETTVVVWISDNGPATTGTGAEEIHAGDAGPFRGELGDAHEGSIRAPAMIRWPGRIRPGTSNEMFAIHDLLPTLAAIAGGKVPDDRPIDGVDQSAFLLGRQERSGRDHLLSFIGDRVVAIRWRQWRVYTVEFVASGDNPSLTGALGSFRETNGYPRVFNIEADPKERRNVGIENGWVAVPCLEIVNRYLASTRKFPNPPPPTLTDFR
jgi:arylsulfatase